MLARFGLRIGHAVRPPVLSLRFLSGHSEAPIYENGILEIGQKARIRRTFTGTKSTFAVHFLLLLCIYFGRFLFCGCHYYASFRDHSLSCILQRR